MLFKNPILKDAVIARRVRARALARSKRIEFASLFPPKTCFQVGKRKRRAGHDWFANRQERGRKTGKIRSYNASLSPPPPAPSRTGCSQRGGSLFTSSRHLAVAVGFDARTRCHPLDVTWTSVHANCRESTPMETSGNEPIDRFGASVLEQGGYVSIFNARIGKGFGWSIGDRTGQGQFNFFFFFFKGFLTPFPPPIFSVFLRFFEWDALKSYKVKIITKQFCLKYFIC